MLKYLRSFVKQFNLSTFQNLQLATNIHFKFTISYYFGLGFLNRFEQVLKIMLATMTFSSLATLYSIFFLVYCVSRVLYWVTVIYYFTMFLVVMLQNLWKGISYWYFRYLMVTELYMVEKWERNVINAFAVILFCVLWYFNIHYVVSGTAKALSYTWPFNNILQPAES